MKPKDPIKASYEGNMHSEITDAVSSGNYELVKRLLETGHDVNWADGFGITNLMVSAYKGDREITRLLLEYGANINMKDMNGKTAIDWATDYKHEFLIDIIKSTKKKY